MSQSMNKECNDKIQELGITPEELSAVELSAAASWDVFCSEGCEWGKMCWNDKRFYLICEVMAQRARK